MISLLLMMVAGALNAVMDRISFTFKSSVFKDLNPMFLGCENILEKYVENGR
jgi:hypothetical protein